MAVERLSMRDHSRVLHRASLALAALAVAGAATSVRAPSPSMSKVQAPVCEVTPTLEVLLRMPDKEAELRVQLVHVHRGAYLATGDALHSVRRLFSEFERLEPSRCGVPHAGWGTLPVLSGARRDDDAAT